MNYPIIKHGSENSLDEDVYVIVDRVFDNIESKKLCESYLPLNANLLYVKDGKVNWCYKGTIDECNNSLLNTYNLHKQNYECPIKEKMPRAYSLKILRTLRGLLSYLSRTEYREQVKEALKNPDINAKIKLLQDIYFPNIKDYKKNNNIEVYKFFAFQLGQTLALVRDNKELFTKNQVGEHFHILKGSLNREKELPENVLSIYYQFLDFIKDKFTLINKNNYIYQYNITDNKKEFLDSKNEKTLPMVIVCDLDGTLYDESPRAYLRENGQLEEYFKACDQDKIIPETLAILKEYHKEGYEIWLVSGRYAPYCEEKTLKALADDGVPYHNLKLRGEGVFVPDFVIKPSWCKNLIGLERVHAIYEDQDKVIEGFILKGFTNVIDIKTILNNKQNGNIKNVRNTV